jgi:hypothetical protein
VGEALACQVDADTATRYRAARVVPEAEELHHLLVDAGFHAVQILPSVMTIRLLHQARELPGPTLPLPYPPYCTV